VTTQSHTWQHWWARNRYQFLSFPQADDGSTSRFPATPVDDDSDRGMLSRRYLYQRAKEQIRLFLDDRSARVRQAAVIGLGLLQDDGSVEKLIKALRDNDRNVRHAAVLALGCSRNNRARYVLFNIAKDTAYAHKVMDEQVVAPSMRSFALIAATMVEGHSSTSATALLQKIVDDRADDAEVRAAALIGLGLIGDESATRHLIEFCSARKQDDRLRSQAVTALAKTEETIVLGTLDQALRSSPLVVRQSAALALGYLASRNDATIVSHLFRAYSRTANPVLKGFALVSMGQIGGPAALQRLELVVKRSSSADLSWGCLGLGLALSKMPAHKTPTVLLQRLKHCRNRSDQSAVAIALGLARCGEAAEKLMKLLRDGDDPYLRGYSAMALGMIGDPVAVPDLRQALRERHLPQVNTQAAMALCLLNDRGACDDLLDLLLSSKNEASQAMAARSLVYLGDAAVVENLLEFISTKNSDEITYLYCIELIAKLVMDHKTPYFDRVASCSNYTCEYPIISDILDYGV